MRRKHIDILYIYTNCEILQLEKDAQLGTVRTVHMNNEKPMYVK
jgi:hypothetical protein